ncbi:MAG: Rieske 2Fe-2S domain-containing protein [Planctomycetota bacterium]
MTDGGSTHQVPLGYQRALAASGIACPGVAFCRVGRTALALVHLADGVHALADRCPHQGSSLSEGQLHGSMLVCPSHGWAFDVRTGRSRSALGHGTRAYRARVVNGVVYVRTQLVRTLFAQLKSRLARKRARS